MTTYEEEKVKLRNNPYKYITEEWAEASLMFVGKKMFSVASLMPGSLILPPIYFGSKNISTRINFFYVAPSGQGKSSGSDKLESITYFPLKRRDISAPDLQQRAIQMEMMTLIVEDFSQFSQDYEKVKVLEGMVGEEAEIGKSNMRTELVGDVQAIAFLLGTPVDLERYATQLEGGLLSRCVFMLSSLTPKEHSEIGKFINNRAGDKEFSDTMKIREQVVIDYYQYLKNIQLGKDSEILPIVGYHIEKKFKDNVYEVWSKLSEKLIRDLGEKSYIRDLNYYYKFLVCSAFLNINRRKTEVTEVGRDAESGKIIKGTILYPNEDDHHLAVNLMKENMRHKWALDKALFYKKNIRTLEMFKNILNTSPSEVRAILLNISPHARLLENGSE